MRFLLCVLAFAGLASTAEATFSVVASDSERREVGGAGASCVGDSVSVYRIYGSVPGRGAIHVQALLGTESRMAEALRRLAIEDEPTGILGALTDLSFDPLQARRQYGIADLMQRSAGFTGEENGGFAGHQAGIISPYAYSVQGNLLTGAEVVDAMSGAFETESCDLPDRLMAALEAGAAQGGDERCALDGADGSFIQVDREGEPAGSYLSIRVDNTEAPVEVLRRRFDEWRREHPCRPLSIPEPTPVSPAAGSCNTSASPSSTRDIAWLGLLLLFFLRRGPAPRSVQ
ncbi:MAG: DUF1028 domain-containing protein [Polyangiales bacterium]